jgi:hypothetical protein
MTFPIKNLTALAQVNKLLRMCRQLFHTGNLFTVFGLGEGYKTYVAANTVEKNSGSFSYEALFIGR